MSHHNNQLLSLGCLSILPPELRCMIYEFVLIDPPKWERPHFDTRCRHHSEYCLRPLHMRSQCRGHYRDGLEMLRVNKALYVEANPIFWSQNTFCFFSADDFISCVGRNLRADNCSLLRHLRIVGTIHYRQRDYSSFTPTWSPDYPKKPFEITLRKCTSLRTLGIDINSVTPCLSWPQYLDTQYVQVLASMISPTVQFSFLKLGWKAFIDTSQRREKERSQGREKVTIKSYDALSQMPYDLHVGAFTNTKTTTRKDLPMRDWELVYEPLCPGAQFIAFLEMLEGY
ncbi:hypothetical protein F4808DRAFT_336797 [Astrocystis sublimbata]|nr:hypothetical protein F4808DRAFT_336797 [Astrocystis sublimbata]